MEERRTDLGKRLVDLYREAYAGLPRGAWILALSEFINRCGFMVLVFLNIYLTRRLGFTLLQAGRILSAFGLGSVAGGYFGGALCDRIGVRRVMLGSLVLSGLLLIGAGYVTGYGPLLGIMFVYGVVSAALFPANDTAMARLCSGEMRSRGFALRRLAANLGITFGPVVGGYLILIDYRRLFWADGLTTLAAAFVLGLFMKDLPDSASPPAAVEAPQALRSPWRDGTYLLFMGFFLILMTVFSQLFSTFNLYLNTKYGLRESQIGPLWAFNTVLIVGVEMALIHALRRRSEMKVISLGACLVAIGFAALPLGRGFAFAALTVVVWTVGEILTMPLTATVAAARAGSASGRYMGVLSLVYSLAMLVAPFVGNWLYGSIGGDGLWPVMGAAGLISAAGFYALRKKLDVPKAG
jgi:predicted MFS family arabinose efflux permease